MLVTLATYGHNMKWTSSFLVITVSFGANFLFATKKQLRCFLVPNISFSLPKQKDKASAFEHRLFHGHIARHLLQREWGEAGVQGQQGQSQTR